MAVPASGALNMLNLAREALYGTWGSGTITGPISLYDMVNGGNTNGSGNSYPTVNDDCLPNPVSRNSSILAQVALNSGTPTNYYFNQNIGVASDLTVGDELFTDTSLTTSLAAGNYYQSSSVNNNNQYYCYVNNACGPTFIQVNSGGAITQLYCDFCP